DEDRDLSQIELMGRARELLARFPKELSLSVGQVASISGAGYRNADVQYVISGPNLNKLMAYSGEVLKPMEKNPYGVDADNPVVPGQPELRVIIDRQRAADLGVGIGDIAQTLNILIAGQPVSSFSVGDIGGVSGVSGVGAGAIGEASPGAGPGEYNVVVRTTGQFRRNKEDLRKLTVPSTRGRLIHLQQVGRIEDGAGRSSINRLNRQRQITLLANVKPGGSQSKVMAELDKIAKEMKLAPNAANTSGYAAGLAGRSKGLGPTGYYFAPAITLSI